MARIVAYSWFTWIMWITAMLPDVTPVLKLRGLLVRVCFKSCGRNFQIASGVRITFPTRIDIGHDVYLAPGCWIQGIGGVVLEDEVMLGPYTVLASTNHVKKKGSYRFGGGRPEAITLRRGAWTGAHSILTAGVTVGSGAAVAAGAVVTGDVLDDTVVAGVPARVIRQEHST